MTDCVTRKKNPVSRRRTGEKSIIQPVVPTSLPSETLVAAQQSQYYLLKGPAFLKLRWLYMQGLTSGVSNQFHESLLLYQYQLFWCTACSMSRALECDSSSFVFIFQDSFGYPCTSRWIFVSSCLFLKMLLRFWLESHWICIWLLVT